MPKRTSVTYVAKLDVPEEKLSEYREAFDMSDKDHSRKARRSRRQAQ